MDPGHTERGEGAGGKRLEQAQREGILSVCCHEGLWMRLG